MSDSRPAMDTFRSEADRFIKQLQGRRGFQIEISELIGDENRITFISSIAGSGKSVLVKKCTYHWATGDLFKDLKVCITLECRELNYFVQNEGKKFEKHEQIIKFIKGKFGFNVKDSKNVLFIVDGLDELYDINSNNSIIGQLLDLKKSKYPESKVIITGRPHIENMLSRHGGRNMGGVRKVEIIGLSDEQIDEYIRKFASSDVEKIAKINKAKCFSQTNIKLLSIPQMLNSFCCVALLSENNEIKNAAELYCWSFYLLLKQHAEKVGSCDKRIPEIFSEYSKDLLVLSKVCHKLLIRNTIIFEGNIEFGEAGKGKEFLKGLFVDASNDFAGRQQFKHLTLMEFLSAVYVCTTENRTEIIKDILEKKLYQVLLFSCELISGLMYDGIMKEMFKNAAKLKEINCYNFFCNVLELVRDYVQGDDDDSVNESFELSVDVIMCLLSKDIVSKQFILSIVNQLSFKNVSLSISSRKLIEMIKPLNEEFECSEVELKTAFENVHFGLFIVVNELNDLKYAKFLASVDVIRLNGRMAKITTTIRDICKECGNCIRVSVLNCKFPDEDFEDEFTENSKLELLFLAGCTLYEESFFNLCQWTITSLVEELILHNIKDMRVEWWDILVDAIVNEREKSHGDLALRKLEIWECPLMNDEMKKKVIT